MGVVYGPNENNTGFYKKVRKILVESDLKFIIGGDFNTILSNEEGINNVDRIGNGRVPNSQNSRLINEWITEGFVLEPFRALYPLQQEASHIPFRSDMDRIGVRNYVHNRLDFFLVSPELLDLIGKVRYEDRLSADFDHKEVVLTMGRAGKNVNKIVIHNSTLADLLSDNVGLLAVYDALCTHFRIQDVELNNMMYQIDRLIREKELLWLLIRSKGEDEIIRERLNTADANLSVMINRIPKIENLLEREFSCNFRQLYEVCTMNLKNRLVALQKQRINELNINRDNLLERIRYLESKFGANSVQALDEKDKLLRMDDQKLKDRATKFKEFLDANNEKATAAFCRLGK
jgi:hypothetical protein